MIEALQPYSTLFPLAQIIQAIKSMIMYSSSVSFNFGQLFLLTIMVFVVVALTTRILSVIKSFIFMSGVIFLPLYPTILKFQELAQDESGLLAAEHVKLMIAYLEVCLLSVFLTWFEWFLYGNSGLFLYSYLVVAIYCYTKQEAFWIPLRSLFVSTFPLLQRFSNSGSSTNSGGSQQNISPPTDTPIDTMPSTTTVPSQNTSLPPAVEKVDHLIKKKASSVREAKLNIEKAENKVEKAESQGNNVQSDIKETLTGMKGNLSDGKERASDSSKKARN